MFCFETIWLYNYSYPIFHHFQVICAVALFVTGTWALAIREPKGRQAGELVGAAVLEVLIPKIQELAVGLADHLIHQLLDKDPYVSF